MKESNCVEGLVTEVIYANDNNGYKVCEVEQEDGGTVTIVGILPDLQSGESVRAEGIWKQHAVYGPQSVSYTHLETTEQKEIGRFLKTKTVFVDKTFHDISNINTAIEQYAVTRNRLSVLFYGGDDVGDIG